MKHIFFFIVLFAAAAAVLRMVPVSAQPVTTNHWETMPDTAESETKIKAFFDAVSKGNTRQALDDLLWNSPLNSSPPAIEGLKAQIDGIKVQFGNILASEKFDVKTAGEDVVVLRYILKCEQYPVIWSFTLYRKPASPIAAAVNAWTLVELHFNTDFSTI